MSASDVDLKKKLENSDYNAAAIVQSGEEAIIKAKKIKPDLILMDIMLEGEMDGIEAGRSIKECLDVPIIYITAFGDKETLQKAKVTEPHGYILKPFEEKEVIYAIEIALYKHERELKLKESLIQKEILLEEINYNLQKSQNNITDLMDHGFKRINSKSELTNPSIHDGYDNKFESNQDDFAIVDFAMYLENIVEDVSSNHNLNPLNVKLNVENIFLDLDIALSYGIILTELLKNCYNIISNSEFSAINIDFYIKEGCYVLTISDKYNNFLEMFQSSLLNNKLINKLVKQHQGTIQFNERSEIKIIFGN